MYVCVCVGGGGQLPLSPTYLDVTMLTNLQGTKERVGYLPLLNFQTLVYERVTSSFNDNEYASADEHR